MHGISLLIAKGHSVLVVYSSEILKIHASL